MRLKDLLNQERVNALYVEPNSYVASNQIKRTESHNVKAQAEKVIFPEPYENASPHYNKQEFYKPTPPEPQKQNQSHQMPTPMFDMKSILPMLMSGKFNDVLKPLMSMFGGGGGSGLGDVTKIFELFKPKSKTKTKKEKDEDISSKFDDMIIIED